MSQQLNSSPVASTLGKLNSEPPVVDPRVQAQQERPPGVGSWGNTNEITAPEAPSGAAPQAQSQAVTPTHLVVLPLPSTWLQAQPSPAHWPCNYVLSPQPQPLALAAMWPRGGGSVGGLGLPSAWDSGNRVRSPGISTSA